MSSKTVIITDGEQRAALATVRSLGPSYRCVVTASSRASISSASRFCARSVLVPDALREPSAFAAAITDLAADQNAGVVLPISEQSLLALLPARAALAPAVIPFPSLEAFSALCDKRALLEQAAQLGVRTPAQRVIENVTTCDSVDLEELQYPIVIKPARSVAANGNGHAKFTVFYAVDANTLRRKIRSMPPAAFPLLLQQRIVGPGVGVFLLLWEGELLAQFAHKRLCEKPPSGGVSVYRESVGLDAKLLDQSRALLEHFGWQGVAMVEYKRDSATGEDYLMEVNGRFWGSLQLAIDSGVDFPRLLMACALGEPVKPVKEYRIGVRSRWLWGQVDHIAGRMKGRSALPLPPDTRSVARAFGDLFLGPFRRGDYEEVLWWTDPRPFLNETIRWMAAR